MAGWSVAAGLCTAVASALGFAIGNGGPGSPVGRPDESEFRQLAIVCGSTGAIGGLLVGVFFGFISTNGTRAANVIVLGLSGGTTGALGGFLSSFAVGEIGSAAPAIASLTLAWGIAGLVVGGIAYPIWRRISQPPEIEDEDEPVQPVLAATAWPVPKRNRAAGPWQVLRLFPILAAIGYALIAAAVASPSLSTHVLIAIALLGFANLYSIIDQDLRLRRLERQRRQ